MTRTINRYLVLMQYLKSIFLLWLFLLLLVTTTWKTAYAQDPLHLHLNKENGIPSQKVYDIMQDSKGFVWIACEEGLVRYDGSQFRIFRNANQVYLPGSSLQEDKLGRIWYENFDGRLFYFLQDSLHRFSSPEVFNYYPISIASKYLFQIQNERVDVYDIYSLKRIKKLPIGEVLQMDVSKEGYLIKEHEKIVKIDTLLRVKEYQSKLLSKFPSRCFHVNDKLLLFTNSFDAAQQLLRDKALQDWEIIVFDKANAIHGCYIVDGDLWLATSNGAFCLDASGKVKRHLFEGDNISKIITDREGNFWFASTVNGIYIVTNFDDSFISIKTFSPKHIHYYKDQFIITDERGQFWQASIGTSNIETTKMPFIPTGAVYYSYIDTPDAKLYYSSIGSFSSKIPASFGAKPLNFALKEICPLDDKYMAFAANGFFGLMKRNNDNGSSEWDNLYEKNDRINSQDNISFLLGGNPRGRCLTYDAANTSIYLSSNLGTYKITPYSKKEITYKGEKLFARKLFFVKEKLVVLTTAGKLLTIKNDTAFSDLSIQFNIAPSGISFIKQFGEELFIITDDYISRLGLHPEKLDIVKAFIHTKDINDFLVIDNRLIIITDRGIAKLPLLLHSGKSQSASLIINSIKVNGERYLNDNLLEIPALMQSMEIDYSYPEFATATKQLIKYRLDQNEWIQIPPGLQKITIMSLPPGKHTMQFMAGNVLQQTMIHLNVQTPYWKSWWFYFLLIALVVLLSYIIYQRRLQAASQKIALLEEKINLERELGRSVVKSIKAQMNPHFFYNALNTIQAYIYTNDKKKAGDYLSKFSKLTRMILEMSEKEWVSVSEERQSLNLYLELEKMRFDENLSVSLTISDEIDQDFIKIPSMLIQPYVENALKHGLLNKKEGVRILAIDFKKAANQIHVTVQDNGIGRAKAMELNQLKYKEHISFATDANMKRIDVVNKNRKEKIIVTTSDRLGAQKEPLGTAVSIIIPLTETTLQNN